MRRRTIIAACALLAGLLVPAPAVADHRGGGCHTKACVKRVVAKMSPAERRAACRSAACKRRVRAKRARELRRQVRRSGRPALASWYGPGFYGNTTACGQTYTSSIVGVAHKTLPCGTRVRVCFRGCAVGRVIDRGPYSGAREFDLSAAMARAVGFSGVATVRVRVG